MLMAALLGGFYGTANAIGHCRMGTAHLTPDGSGGAYLTCPGNGTCYETDNTGSMDPGHHILIHLGDERIDAVIVKAEASGEVPPDTPPDQPTDKLPGNVLVNFAKATH